MPNHKISLNPSAGANGPGQPKSGNGSLPLSGGQTLGQLPQMASGGMPSELPQ